MAVGKLMFCIRCQNDIAYCTCPDIEERLKAIAASGNWAMNKCVPCHMLLAAFFVRRLPTLMGEFLQGDRISDSQGNEDYKMSFEKKSAKPGRKKKTFDISDYADKW